MTSFAPGFFLIRYRYQFLSWILPLLTIAGTIWYAQRMLPPQFPLFFSLPSGTVDQLARLSDLYQIVAAILIVITINFILSICLSTDKYKILSNILIIIQIVISLVFSLSIWQVIHLIT